MGKNYRQMILSNGMPEINFGLTRTENILDGEDWTSDWQRSRSPQMAFRLRSDQNLEVYFEFSIDGEINDSANLPPYRYKAGTVQPPHKLEVVAAFWRVRIENNSGSNTSIMRFQAIEAPFRTLTSPLNSVIGQNADAEVTRSVPAEIEIAAGKYDGWDLNNKFGKNSDVDSGTLPEDIVEVGGVYTGFPDNSTPQRFFLVSSSTSDTGQVSFSYLASNTSTEWQTATVTLNGTTAVDTGIDGIRAHTMRYDSGSTSTFNVGVITLRNAGSTVTWLTIAIGRSQSNYAVYTIPAGNTGYIQHIHGSIRGGNSTTVDGALWYRGSGQSPRLRRPFTIGLNSRLDDRIYGGLPVPAGADVTLRILAASGNNIEVSAGFDIVLIRNIDG